MKQVVDQSFFENVRALIQKAQQTVVRQVNSVMVFTYFELGKQIVEQEQKGKEQADYGSYLLSELSEKLTAEFGKGYSKRNLELIRKFYFTYKIAKTPFSQSLSWSHYLLLMRIANDDERSFYEIETEKNNWSFRELNRQINSALYNRLQLSKDRNQVEQLALLGQLIEKPSDLIKDPYILEFLNLTEQANYSESELEQAIIDRLEHFLFVEEPINLYDFATYFKEIGCKNALYLDGYVSRTYLPTKNWVQTDGDFGVMIGVCTKKN